MVRKRDLFCLIVSLLVVTATAWTQTEQGQQFNYQEVMVPMRDGVKLQTAIFVPKNTKEPLPFLLVRTPYGVPENENRLVKSGNYDELIADGYIFVWQNLRGRFKSEGAFVMQRPPRDKSKPNSIDEGTDAYDTIDWLIKNIPNNNRRAGIFGISYSGWTTVMALLEPHPALKAASEQATAADMFLGDDFHHNGAFRLSYGFEYSALLETAKEENTNFKFDRYDTYDWYLNLGALSHVNEKYFHGALPTWNDFVAHPNYDEFWKKQVFATYLQKTTVPNLNVAGWWDQEDFYGPMKVYDLLEKNDDRHLNYVVAGPWNHGGWGDGAGRSLDKIDFGSDTAKFFRAKVQAPWFAYWLHDKGKLTQPEALTFQTGSNQWKSYEAWPPVKGITKKQLYFHAGGKLSFDAPAEPTSAFDSYVSDPANPVPYRPRPITPTYPGPDWRGWLVQDQRFVDHRPDVLSWETEPLKENVEIAGDIVANLFASTSGSDSDWIVKLIDVYPENYTQQVNSPECADMNKESSEYEQSCMLSLGGYQLMIADEVFRGRFRKSFEHPEPIASGQVLDYHIGLHTNNHAFLKGHRIMVQVQSTWFPIIDRNPQKYVPNIFEARDSDYVKATQRIFRTKSYPSNVLLPVVTGGR
jgi:putative CocE/NonD family hydrolase